MLLRQLLASIAFIAAAALVAAESASTAQLNGLPDRHGGCMSRPTGSALSLSDAIELALCNNPRTQKAWASAVAAVDELRINQGDYLPTLTANGTIGPSRVITETAAAAFDSDIRSNTQSGGLDFSLTLLDFGRRKANVERARQLLTAANASRDLTLIDVFLDTAQAYYDTLDAEALLQASQRSEGISEKSLEVAAGRHRGGTAAITDQLQAETAHLQDKARRIAAQSGAATARGVLAVTLGLDANTAFTLSTNPSESPKALALDPPDKLLAEAKANNPQITEARARYLAAHAAVNLAVARRFPTVTLRAAYNTSDYSLTGSNTFGITDAPRDRTLSNASVQLRISVPLFDGFVTAHAIHEARADAEVSRTDLEAAEQQVTLNVWRAYQQVTVQGENIEVTKEILRVASESLRASETRYRLGSGNIIEVLNAQTALAMAERQRIDTLSNWRTARLRLVAALGHLGMWAIE